ncbi:MAG: TonB family protein [Bacteroidales bacterium]|nr:TonB family protein [Bacteroidales bacterium]
MSAGKSTYGKLFNPSGCLKAEAMERYLNQRLSRKELEEVKKHLSGCPLCRDALEGFGQNDYSVKFRAMTQEIDARIKRRIKAGGSGVIRGMPDRTFYLAIAATVVMLLGVTYLLFLQTERSDKTVGDLMENKPATEETVEIAEDNESVADTEVVKQAAEVPEKFPEPEMTVKADKENMSEEFKAEHDEATMALVELPQEMEQIDLKDNMGVEESVGNGGNISVAEAPVTEVTDPYKPDEVASWRDHTPDKKGLFGHKNSKIAKQETESSGLNRAEEPGSEAIEEDETGNIFTVVELMPQFPGGPDSLNSYLVKNLHYPDSARKAGIQGEVFIGFTVKRNGTIADVKTLRGIGFGCDEEAVRVVESMPPWEPGKQRGKNVDVLYTIPISFRLH